jgi:hypothetical protein
MTNYKSELHNNYKKKLLFICPEFHGYEKVISDALLKSNYDLKAIIYNEYELFNFNIYQKIIKNFLLKLKLIFIYDIVNRFFFKKLNNIISKENDQKYDILFVVKGYGVSKKTINSISAKKKIIYQWDPVEKFPSVKAIYSYFDKHYTYSILDAKRGFGLLLPNFALDEIDTYGDEKNECFFIGEYSNYRKKILEKIYKKMISIGVPCNFILVNFTKHIKHSSFLEIRNSKVERKEYLRYARQSKIYIDISRFGDGNHTPRFVDAQKHNKYLISETEDYGISINDIFDVDSIDQLHNLLAISFEKKEKNKIHNVNSWLSEILK